jgi:DivIVA domain-containing protein
MMWLFAILLVLAMGGIALLAAGKGTPMSEVYDDRPDALVPAEGDLTGDDLRRVRFSLAFRGYRMSEVDALLERLATQVDPTEAEQPGPAPEPAPAPEAAPEAAPAPGPGPRHVAAPASQSPPVEGRGEAETD